MTAVEIATGIIDKLQDENRGILETLHKAQDTIKYSERQLAEKDRVIKVLEERIRAGTDGILEMTNRQKELTIKHLEMQIQKLLKENEDVEVRLEALKAEICPKCETKLLMSENRECALLSKSYKPPGKSSNILLEKKSSQTLCPNRVKALERIIEHKDKRIMHLTKEVKRLTKLEDELTKKIYRLTKLLPMSRLPPDAITDCLLKEIQLLESQKQRDGSTDPLMGNVLNRINKPSASYQSSNKTNFSKSNARIKTSVFTEPKAPVSNLLDFEEDVTKFENEVLQNKLQKLCHGINELKRLFAFESETLSHGLNSSANDFRLFKMNLEEIINNLNEIMQNILSGDFRYEEKDDLGYQSDDKYVISCLQTRLKDSLGMITDYEEENKMLKDSLEKLKAQMMQQDSFPDYLKKSGEKLFKSFSGSKCTSNISDIKKLQEIIKDKEAQLEAAESHINTCQKFIDELQKNVKQAAFQHPKIPSPNSTDESSLEAENKNLKTMLNVSEKNIKTCETVIEQLQNKNRHLEEENERLESKLHEYKSKAISEESDKNSASLSKFNETHTLKKFNHELQEKTKSLEETIKKLEGDISSEKSKNVTSEALAQEKMRLQSKLDAADKQINTLQKSIEILQEKLRDTENQKNKFETQLREMVQTNTLAEVYENDVMALKNELILKEDENRELKEALHTLESKTLEMNHYRNSLHQEIENLCKALMENEESEDSERRKAIYKAAVLRSAQALLRLDDNYNLKSDDSDRSSALDEMTHQIQVYLTEVSRIHELLTIKEQERDELLKEYLNLDDDTNLKVSSPRLYESHVQEEPVTDDLHSSPDLKRLKSPDFTANETVPKTLSVENIKFQSALTASELKNVQEELAATKSVTDYLLSSCTRLEDLLSKEKTDRAKCEKELEVCQEIIKDLKAQLSSKNNMTKRLNNLIEWMRSKEFNDEISLEQLKNEIQWLAEKATTTETELCQCKEENCKMKIELNSMKRELMNEKYEKAKTNNELKKLKMQILNSDTLLDETPIT